MGLDEDTCARVLDFLVEAKFLFRMRHGAYARLTDGSVRLPSLRMAKASLDSLRASKARAS